MKTAKYIAAATISVAGVAFIGTGCERADDTGTGTNTRTGTWAGYDRSGSSNTGTGSARGSSPTVAGKGSTTS